MSNPGHKPVTPFKPDPDHRQSFPLASELREKGFVPLPRLWIRASDMPEIYEIVARHTDDVLRIRREVYTRLGMPIEERKSSKHSPNQIGDPVSDKEAAWAAFERKRRAG